ncbi:hypothetical protein F5B19DRAFT_429888 [Rostrohypoxylon terebratum]|nr:hypothetical protein F5B19DRAFT_429888 [Rostrohypoxylon terebratum]
MSLSNLPTETLSLILKCLADEDLATLLIAQRVCKRFHAIIQHILEHHSSDKEYLPQADASQAVNPLLWQHFSHILDTLEVSLASGRQGRAVTDINLPFYELPWVRRRTPVDEEGRRPRPRNRDVRGIPHLRPEASWRRLSLTWGMDPGIKRLDIVHWSVAHGGTGLSYTQLEIPSTATADGKGGGDGVLTMGLFYDLMTSGVRHKARLTKGWQLMLGCRLGNYDNWKKMRSRSQYPTRGAIKSLLVPEEGSAVLYAPKYRSCIQSSTHLRKESENEDDLAWDPKPIGGLPIVSRPWQGPDNDWSKMASSGDLD